MAGRGAGKTVVEGRPSGAVHLAPEIILPRSIERRRLDDLKPYPQNSRTHSRAQIRKLVASIAEFGFVNPVLIGKDGDVIAGHARIAAARELGMQEIPVLVLDHLTPTQRRALVIADNRLGLDAGWDFDLLASELTALQDLDFPMDLIGFDSDELLDLLGTDVAAEETIPDPPEVPVSREGDLWHLGEHVLLCGDCTDADTVQRAIGETRATLFVTDPPYLVNYTGLNHPTTRPKGNKDWRGDYEDWDNPEQGRSLYDAFIKQAIDHAIAPEAAWYCWHASRNQSMVEQCWIDAGAFVHQQIVWVKTRGVLTRSTFLWRHEPCLHGWLRGHRPPFRRQREDPTTVWEIPSSEVESKDHPTSKPVRLFEIPMLVHTQPGDTCYEPFSGSGSQIIAAERTGRRCVAIEINPRFVDVALLRWQAATGKQATLDGDGRSFNTIGTERGTAQGATGEATRGTAPAPGE